MRDGVGGEFEDFLAVGDDAFDAGGAGHVQDCPADILLEEGVGLDFIFIAVDELDAEGDAIGGDLFDIGDSDTDDGVVGLDEVVFEGVVAHVGDVSLQSGADVAVEPFKVGRYVAGAGGFEHGEDSVFGALRLWLGAGGEEEEGEDWQ